MVHGQEFVLNKSQEILLYYDHLIHLYLGWHLNFYL